MVWVIVVVAIVVLGLGAWAATGRLGEMPEPVDDRPKGRIPEGPVDAEFLAALRFPKAATGYAPAQVDDYLRAFVDRGAEPLEAVFDLVPAGYDMQAVDAVLDRAAAPHPPAHAVATEAPEATSEPEPEAAPEQAE